MDDELDLSADIEGQFSEAKVQSKGRINLPNPYLEYIGVEEGDKVFIVVKDGELVVKEASIDMVGAVCFTEPLTFFKEKFSNDE